MSAVKFRSQNQRRIGPGGGPTTVQFNLSGGNGHLDLSPRHPVAEARPDVIPGDGEGFNSLGQAWPAVSTPNEQPAD